MATVSHFAATQGWRGSVRLRVVAPHCAGPPSRQARGGQSWLPRQAGAAGRRQAREGDIGREER
eukprot:3280169-Pyramimonas_sp.AAC.1